MGENDGEKGHGRHHSGFGCGPDFWKDWGRWRKEFRHAHREARKQAREAWREHLREAFGPSLKDHWFFGGRRMGQWCCGPEMFNPFVMVMFSKGGGLLPLYVLHLLSEQPRYGNDVMRELQERTEGGWPANPGAIYPMLSLMEARGLISGDWEQTTKRTRRFYEITDEGRQELRRLKEVMRPEIEEAIEVLGKIYADLYPEENTTESPT